VITKQFTIITGKEQVIIILDYMKQGLKNCGGIVDNE